MIVWKAPRGLPVCCPKRKNENDKDEEGAQFKGKRRHEGRIRQIVSKTSTMVDNKPGMAGAGGRTV